MGTRSGNSTNGFVSYCLLAPPIFSTKFRRLGQFFTPLVFFNSSSLNYLLALMRDSVYSSVLAVFTGALTPCHGRSIEFGVVYCQISNVVVVEINDELDQTKP